MTYFFMLVAVFLWSFIIAGYVLRNSGLTDNRIFIWMLTLSSLSTFFFHNIW